MKDHTSAIIHFVKLIDAANTTVRKDKSTTFEDNFTSLWVLGDINCETDCRGALARSVDTPRSNFVNILQEL